MNLFEKVGDFISLISIHMYTVLWCVQQEVVVSKQGSVGIATNHRSTLIKNSEDIRSKCVWVWRNDGSYQVKDCLWLNYFSCAIALFLFMFC